MDKRQQQLQELKSFTNNIEKEVTLLLQNFQWDPIHTTEKSALVICKHNSNHRIPLKDRDTHEKQCYLKMLGYHKEDAFLPDPVDPDAKTNVKFTKEDITNIIKNAGIKNPLLQRGKVFTKDSNFYKEIMFCVLQHYICGWFGPDKLLKDSVVAGCLGPEPLTVERLQRDYSADERRAIHDAVVSTAPLVHDLTELDLLGPNNGATTGREKSRLEILSELRNMKRRRTKYRVAPTTRNYSDVLRDVIKTQMESYGEATNTIIKTEYGPNVNVSQKVTDIQSKNSLQSVPVKLERKSPVPTDRQSNSNSRERYITDSRLDSRDRDDNRRHYNTDQSSNRRHVDRYNSHQIKERHDNSDRRHCSKDKHEISERNRTYNEKDRSRGRHNDDGYQKDRRQQHDPYNRNKHEVIIKQERESQESDSYSIHNRDRDHSRKRHHGRSRSQERRDPKNSYKDKHNEEHGKRQRNHERYYPNVIVKQEIALDGDRGDNNGEGYIKRHRERSRSKEKRHKHKRKHQRDTSPSRKHKHKKRKREYSPDIKIATIKLETISP